MRVVVVYENSDEQLIAPRVAKALSQLVASIVSTIVHSSPKYLAIKRVSVSVGDTAPPSMSTITLPSLDKRFIEPPKPKPKVEPLPSMKPPSDIRKLDLDDYF